MQLLSFGSGFKSVVPSPFAHSPQTPPGLVQRKMECGGCHQPRKDLFCARCLTQGLKKHTEANQILTTQLNASRTRSDRILNGASSSSRGLDADRVLSARVSQLATQNTLLEEEVQRQREACKKKGQALRARRETVLARRKALAGAFARKGEERNLVAEIADTRRATLVLGQRLQHARRVLVCEAIDIFGVKRTQGEVGGKGKRTADDWEIVGLTMPLPQSFTEYSSVHLNAVFEHLIHLLITITGYLDLSVPFAPQWAGSTLVKDNAIYAGAHQGSTSGDASAMSIIQSRAQIATKAPARHVGKIHLSASSTIPFIRSTEDSTLLSAAISPTLQKRALLYVSSSREKWKRRQRKHSDQVSPFSAELAAARVTRDKHREKEDHLNLSYTMLLLDVLYIAQTQGVAWLRDVLKASSRKDGNAAELVLCPLRLIDDLRWSEGLGSISHGPSPTGQLFSITFPVDFTRLHVAVVAAFERDAPPLKGCNDKVYPKPDNPDRTEGIAADRSDVDDWDLV
ncbi:hypothetical protein NliqN6_2058 [Naganishia liquefaciens]|uniref:Autophagy-related protein 14 n=1 Tax=Naganishia liquefaciens TaxID=104408 RepID=A0A8H3TRJ7_9TREE|nr:hypothetical protein NliqN6_2058 [Naganishia liquefaciens]